jgi:two-component system response regulator MtrA
MLTLAGYEPTPVFRGDQAIEAFHRIQPHLILLDQNLPGLKGIEVCREIRKISRVPIIMVTASEESSTQLAADEVDVDEYVVKLREKSEQIVKKIQKHIRRTESQTPAATELRIGDLIIDVAGHAVRRGNEVIQLTVREFRLLETLARKPWQVYTREQLLEEVWEYRYAADTRLVNVHVQRLRAKVEIDPERPEIVLTVRGVGYKAGTS